MNIRWFDTVQLEPGTSRTMRWRQEWGKLGFFKNQGSDAMGAISVDQGTGQVAGNVAQGQWVGLSLAWNTDIRITASLGPGPCLVLIGRAWECDNGCV